MSTVKSFYGRGRWLRLRSNILRRDEYVCRHCKRFGNTTEATHVHHVFPIETHWELRFNPFNLISLCNKCHERMHDRVTDAIAPTGLEWQKRLKYKIGIEPPT